MIQGHIYLAKIQYCAYFKMQYSPLIAKLNFQQPLLQS